MSQIMKHPNISKAALVVLKSIS